MAWDEEFQVFTVNSDVEETSIRSEDISLDYEFFHSDTMTSVKCGSDYPVKITPRDINTEDFCAAVDYRSSRKAVR